MSGVEAKPREVLVVSPHPDDEVIGAGPTLIRLKEAGFHVINFAVGLGRPEQHARRQAELEIACERLGIDLVVAERPVAMSRRDNLYKAQRQIKGFLKEQIDELQPEVIISPGVHDRHPAHEVTARSVSETLKATEHYALWWAYKIWGNLINPTLYSPFGRYELDKASYALDAHKGENERNNYKAMLKGDALSSAVRGTEVIFGFGTPKLSREPYANIFTELMYDEGRWIGGEHRVLDAKSFYGRDLTEWVNSPSPYRK